MATRELQTNMAATHDLPVFLSMPGDMQREVYVLLQAIQRAEQEPYIYLAMHLKERLRLIQEDHHR